MKKTLLIVSLTFTMLFARPIGVPTLEIEALEVLYDSTDGDNWINHTNSEEWRFL